MAVIFTLEVVGWLHVDNPMAMSALAFAAGASLVILVKLIIHDAIHGTFK